MGKSTVNLRTTRVMFKTPVAAYGQIPGAGGGSKLGVPVLDGKAIAVLGRVDEDSVDGEAS